MLTEKSPRIARDHMSHIWNVHVVWRFLYFHFFFFFNGWVIYIQMWFLYTALFSRDLLQASFIFKWIFLQTVFVILIFTQFIYFQTWFYMNFHMNFFLIASVSACLLWQKVTDYFAYNMDAAGKQSRSHARITMPALNCLFFFFSQWMSLIPLEPFDGFEVFPECSLLDPNPKEKQCLRFMLSQLTGPTCWWMELLIATKSRTLSSVAQFVKLLVEVFWASRV